MTTIMPETTNPPALIAISPSNLALVTGGAGGGNGDSGNNGNQNSTTTVIKPTLTCSAGYNPVWTEADGQAGVAAAGGNVNVNASGHYENFHCDVAPTPPDPLTRHSSAR